jgi:hypothetical protein
MLTFRPSFVLLVFLVAVITAQPLRSFAQSPSGTKYWVCTVQAIPSVVGGPADARKTTYMSGVFAAPGDHPTQMDMSLKFAEAVMKKYSPRGLAHRAGCSANDSRDRAVQNQRVDVKNIRVANGYDLVLTHWGYNNAPDEDKDLQ